MTVKTCIYLIDILICLCSLPLLVYSVKNKNKNDNKYSVILSVFFTIYLIFCLYITIYLHLDLGLEFLIIEIISFLAIIIYITTIIIHLINIVYIKVTNDHLKKPEESEKTISSNKKLKLTTITLLLLPVILFTISFSYEMYAINTSDLILVFYSRGNGGIGDGQTFAYAIKNDHCKNITIGLDIYGLYMSDFINADYTNIIKELNDSAGEALTYGDYSIELDGNNISIYKDEEYIPIKQLNQYINVSLEKAFYIQH